MIWFNLHKPLKAFGHSFKFKFYHYKIGVSYKKRSWYVPEAILL